MDFSLTDEQNAIQELANTIVAAEVTPERLSEVEAKEVRFDTATWRALAAAGLVGLSLPGGVGGGGLGLIEDCLVAEQVARRVAYVPALPSMLVTAPAIVRFGSAEQRERWLPGLSDGSHIASAAIGGVVSEASNLPLPHATPDATGWRLRGSASCVPFATEASVTAVPALTEDGRVSVFLVSADEPGVVLEPLVTTSGLPEARMTLDEVGVGPAECLGSPGDGDQIVEWMSARGAVGAAVMMAGICAEALQLTTEYVKTREQFGRAIGTFQAVAHRSADAYVDAEAVRLTAWRAASALAEGQQADDLVAIAKFWASEGGQRVVHAAQHLHGGIGVDRDYPLFRYFLWAKHLELTHSGASQHLARLGERMALGV